MIAVLVPDVADDTCALQLRRLREVFARGRVAGLQVSNHGGCELNRVLAAIDLLSDIVKAANQRVPGDYGQRLGTVRNFVFGRAGYRPERTTISSSPFPRLNSSPVCALCCGGPSRKFSPAWFRRRPRARQAKEPCLPQRPAASPRSDRIPTDRVPDDLARPGSRRKQLLDKVWARRSTSMSAPLMSMSADSERVSMLGAVVT